MSKLPKKRSIIVKFRNYFITGVFGGGGNLGGFGTGDDGTFGGFGTGDDGTGGSNGLIIFCAAFLNNFQDTTLIDVTTAAVANNPVTIAAGSDIKSKAPAAAFPSDSPHFFIFG